MRSSTTRTLWVCVNSFGTISRLTIFGNMSELLIADGNTSGALALERLWHTLTANRPFYTVCGYCRSTFDETAAALRPSLYDEHEAVSHASGV